MSNSPLGYNACKALKNDGYTISGAHSPGGPGTPSTDRTVLRHRTKTVSTFFVTELKLYEQMARWRGSLIESSKPLFCDGSSPLYHKCVDTSGDVETVYIILACSSALLRSFVLSPLLLLARINPNGFL